MLLRVLALALYTVSAMANDPAGNRQVGLNLPPEGFSEITINGETYMPTPHEVNPELAEDMVWTQFPPNNLFISDPTWYDAMGNDLIYQRRIWAVPTEQGQIDQFRQLLHERPDRALDLMFAAAVKGKAYIVRFLLGQGVKATASEAEGDDGSLVPLHAAAYQGRLDCVKLLMDEGKLGPNILDDMGGTPLMRACWGKHPDIARHLIDAGADITIRQSSKAEVDQVGVNAFEFACGSGCVECAELILEQAVSLDIEPRPLVTRMALAAAASSKNLDMLTFALDYGGYPMPNENGTFLDPIDLTPSQVSDLEATFDKALRQGALNSIQPLFTYLDSHNSAGHPNFPSLADSTIDTLVMAFFAYSAPDDQFSLAEYTDAFTFIYNLLFTPTSRFTNAATLESKDSILGDALFWAAQNGALEMIKVIYKLYPEIDVNHLSKERQPFTSSTLYTAAGMGRVEIVKWLFETFGVEGKGVGRLDVSRGVGKFVNGPTAMWITVRNGETETVKVLLGEGGGPVEEIRGDIGLGIGDDEEKKRVVVSAAKAFRSPVILWSEEKWKEQYGDPSQSGKGEVDEGADGIEVKYVVLKVTSEDEAWLGNVQIRKTDEELLKDEKIGRELKPKPA